MLPDTGERYLSTPLFESIATEMTEEELALAADAPILKCEVPLSSPVPAPLAKPTAEIEEFVRGVLEDRARPVVMFAFEWCEFCWSVRKLFKKAGIDFRSVDIDSIEYQKDDRGGKIRAAVAARTGVVTIPQVFVGGQFVGGASEVFDGFKKGTLQKLLRANGVALEEGEPFDPYALLPNWLSSQKSQ
jgi:cysteine synthase A